MPILILGGLVIVALIGYILITEHRELFVREKDEPIPPNDPFNVIYLPADLEEEKAKHEESTEEKK